MLLAKILYPIAYRGYHENTLLRTDDYMAFPFSICSEGTCMICFSFKYKWKNTWFFQFFSTICNAIIIIVVVVIIIVICNKIYCFNTLEKSDERLLYTIEQQSSVRLVFWVQNPARTCLLDTVRLLFLEKKSTPCDY